MGPQNVNFNTEISKSIPWRLLAAVVGFVGSIIIARLLGAETYGIFYMILSSSMILNNVVTGWNDACKKRASQSGFDQSDAFGAALLMIPFSAVILFPLIIILQQTIGSQILNMEHIRLLIIIFMSVSIFDTFEKFLEARSDFSVSFKFSFSQTVLRYATQILLIILGLELKGMVYGLLLSTILVTIPTYTYYINSISLPSTRNLYSIGKYAKSSISNKFIGSTRFRAVVIITGALVGAESAGAYQVAFKITNPIVMIATITGGGLMSRISYQQSINESFKNEINTSLWISTILGIPVIFGAVALSDPIISILYGVEYSAAIPILGIMAIFWTVNAQNKQMVAIVNGIGRPDVNTRILSISLVLFSILAFFLTTNFGLFGIITSLLVSEIARYIFSVYYIKNLVGDISIISKNILEQLFASVVMYGFVEIVKFGFDISNILNLFATIAMGGLIYGVILTILNDEIRRWVTGSVQIN